MDLHNVSEYVHWDLHPPGFYVQDILPEGGVLLLFGAPKVMKSWATQQMAYSIASGRDWLGLTTRRGITLDFQFEISPLAYWWRLVKQNEYYQLERGSTWLYEHSQLGLYLDDPEHFAHIRGHVEEVMPDVIVLDCLAACFRGDESSSRDMSGFIERVDELRRVRDSSIILVHHSRKMPAVSSFTELARGASRLTGWVDSIVCIQDKPGGIKQFQFMARQAQREVPTIDARFENFIFRVV